MPRATIRLLLIEDNPADADLIVERLTEAPDHEFDTSRVSTLAAASEALEHERFDAAVLDLNLADSTGLESVRTLIGHHFGVAIIVVSGSPEEGIRQRALTAGAHEFVTKSESLSRTIWRSVLFAIERQHFQTQQQHIERLVAVHPDAVLVLDQDGIVRFANEAALQLFDQRRDDFLGSRLPFPIAECEVTEIEFTRRKQLRTGEMRVVRFEWAGKPALLASIRDITERRQSEELRVRGRKLEVSNREIREASRLKTDFLAQMSHELRTPLNTIIGFAQLLHDGEVAVDSSEHREFLGDILTSGQYLLKLINDVLDIAKVEAGRIAFRPEPVVLVQLIAEVCAALRPLAARKDIELDIETDPELVEVVLDRTRFRQILQNYLANALRFTPAHGRVTVRGLIEDAEQFRLEVEDTGVGIDRGDLAQIFAEFGQLEASGDQRELGTGLGLAVTKRLVEAQGGSVGVRSVLGQGSVFHAILPRQVGTASWPPVPAQDATDVVGGVLIVDDNPHTRRLMARTVSDLGYTAIYRSNDLDGLEAIKKLDPAAVVVDILSQGMDGFEFIYRMRGLPAHARTPVVVWTNKELSREERARLERFSVTVIPKSQAGTDALMGTLKEVLSSQTLAGE
jgi:signal transduction histidine kinase